jgi:uncharacterized protein (DUF362 family)
MYRLETEKFKVGMVIVKEAKYPKEAPYNPSMSYLEYPFSPHISKESNHVYEGMRKLLFNLGYDTKHWNTTEWNPLGWIIKPKMTVVIKPNFVLSRHHRNKDVYSIITHPSVIRAIADYCWIALKGEGKIIIADAPQYNCNFIQLLELTKLKDVKDFINSFSGAKVEIYDLRDYWSKTRHFPSCVRKLPGDPNGKIVVNLERESAFYNYPNISKLYGAVYNRNETISHHTKERQEYELSRTIFDADVMISVPKLKVHKKVGVTLNLKGLVGICSNKNLCPHYTLGSPCNGGDQYPDGLFTPVQEGVIKFERWMYDHFLAKGTIKHERIHRAIYGFFYLKIFRHFGLSIPEDKRLLDAGNWYGNDTAWRMVVDLAKIIYFVDKKGRLHDKKQRKLFSIIDGIVGGDNDGPLFPDRRPVGVLLGGDNFLAVDTVATRIMGFDVSKLKQFTMLDKKYGFGTNNINEIEIETEDKTFKDIRSSFAFKPHPGWKNHIEYEK